MTHPPKNQPTSNNPIGDLVQVVNEPNASNETPQTVMIDGQSVNLNEDGSNALNKQF